MWISVGTTIFDESVSGMRRLIAEAQSASCASIICREHNRAHEPRKESSLPFDPPKETSLDGNDFPVTITGRL